MYTSGVSSRRPRHSPPVICSRCSSRCGVARPCSRIGGAVPTNDDDVPNEDDDDVDDEDGEEEMDEDELDDDGGNTTEVEDDD